MTFADMDNLGDELLDKSGSPYFSKMQKDMYFNIACIDICEQMYRDSQKTQELSDKLLPITKSFTFTNKTSLIIGTDITNYWHLISMLAEVDISCTSTPKIKNVPIRPLKLISNPTIKSDPFNKPSAINKWYEEKDGALVFNPATAISGSGIYLINPPKINSATSGSTVSIFGDDVNQEIVQRAVAMMDGTIENYNAVAVRNNEIATSKQPYNAG